MVIALFVIMGVSCAKQGYPPGGPTDETPPFLVSSKPESMETNVPRDESIVLEFSEAMDTKSVEDNLFIVPIPSSWPEFEWESGDRILTIRFREPFRENTTYVLSIGTKAHDRRRNGLEESIMLSFSTGARIENGKIAGKVVPYTFFGDDAEDVSGVDVVAYRLDGSERDPDPRNDVPDYVTQSGSDGNYEMVGLSSGTYRLFAIGDRDRNGFYSEGYDTIGVGPHDIVLAEGDSVAYAPDMAVSERDTSGVQLVSIGVPDNRRVELYFDRAVRRESVRFAFEGLDVMGWFIPPDRPGMISAATAPQVSGKRYALQDLQVADREGNGLRPMDVVPYFTGEDRPDTTALEIVEWEPKLLTTGEERIRVVFNRVLDLPEDIHAVLSPPDRGVFSVVRAGSNTLELRPRRKLPEGSRRVVRFDAGKLRGVAGNVPGESGTRLELRVVPSDTLGVIAGRIDDARWTGDVVYRLLFRNVDAGVRKELTVRGTKEWSSGKVLPGRYLCRAYRDEDGDGVLFRGSLAPYRAAEQVFDYPDTILVVSRWINDDNIMIFR